MKYVTPLFLALSPFVQSYQKFEGDQVFRISEKSLDILKLESILGEDVDIWSYKRGAVDVRIPKHQISSFKSWAAEQNLQPEVYIQNVQELIDTEAIRSKASKLSTVGDIKGNDTNQ